MSYLNYNFLYKKGLDNTDYHILQKISQRSNNMLLVYTDLAERMEKLEALELITFIKHRDTLESRSEKVRITKKGKVFLTNLETMGFNDGVASLTSELCDMYETYSKSVGNVLELQSRIIWFITKTGFSNTVIKNEVDSYLSENSTYTKRLDNLFWTPASKAYSIHKNLKDSVLYDRICRRYGLNPLFFVESKKGRQWDWIFNLTRLIPPRKSDKKLFFTGSADGDLLHIQNVKKILLDEIKAI